jgi:hypothetical protein
MGRPPDSRGAAACRALGDNVHPAEGYWQDVRRAKIRQKSRRKSRRKSPENLAAAARATEG